MMNVRAGAKKLSRHKFKSSLRWWIQSTSYDVRVNFQIRESSSSAFVKQYSYIPIRLWCNRHTSDGSVRQFIKNLNSFLSVITFGQNCQAHPAIICKQFYLRNDIKTCSLCLFKKKLWLGVGDISGSYFKLLNVQYCIFIALFFFSRLLCHGEKEKCA